MKKSFSHYPFHPRRPGIRKTIERFQSKLVRFTDSKIPVRFSFRETEKGIVEVCISSHIKGRYVKGVGRGKNYFKALKLAQKAFFEEYEKGKKRYQQNVVRSQKRSIPDMPDEIVIEVEPDEFKEKVK